MLLWKFLNFLIDNCKCARGGHSRVGELFLFSDLEESWFDVVFRIQIASTNQIKVYVWQLTVYRYWLDMKYEILKFKYWSNRTYHLTFCFESEYDSCCFDMFDSYFQIWLNWRDSTIRCYFWFDCNSHSNSNIILFHFPDVTLILTFW